MPEAPEPRETSFSYPEGRMSPLRNKFSNTAPLPSRLSVDNFSRPITEITDEKNNTISIMPKKTVPEPIGQRQLSEQLQGIFPDVDETIRKESETYKERSQDLDEIIDKLSRPSDSDKNDQATFEFEFFTGGVNPKFDSFVKIYGLTNENIQFVDFLQSGYCKEILQSNNLKIHVETGNIYYNDTDTNESIFDFMKNQQNTSKGIINTDLKFDGTYKNYFQWILNEFEAQEKTRYDIFSFKNTKYLAYCFNDLQNSIGEPLIKIRHIVATDNYLAAEEIQNQNWQYFIERVIEVCKSKEAGSTIRPTEDFLLTTVENVTVAKKAYQTFYNVVARNFNSTISKISVDKEKKIKGDLLSKNFWWKGAMNELDSWIVFYYHFVRFP